MKYLHLTDYLIKIPHSARAKTVKLAWAKAEIDSKWAASGWCKKLEGKKRKAAMTDFDRFKLMIAKKRRKFIVDKEVKRMKKKMMAAK